MWRDVLYWIGVGVLHISLASTLPRLIGIGEAMRAMTEEWPQERERLAADRKERQRPIVLVLCLCLVIGILLCVPKVLHLILQV